MSNDLADAHRPDTRSCSDEIRNYIESLEKENVRAQKKVANLQAKLITTQNLVAALEQEMKNNTKLSEVPTSELTAELERLLEHHAGELGYVKLPK